MGPLHIWGRDPEALLRIRTEETCLSQCDSEDKTQSVKETATRKGKWSKAQWASQGKAAATVRGDAPGIRLVGFLEGQRTLAR